MADYQSLKKVLGELLEKKKADEAKAESERVARNDADRTKVLENISGDLAKSLAPVLAELPKSAKVSVDEIRQAISEAIQINMPEVRMPEIKIPDIVVPKPEVTVNVPKAEVPVVNVPPPVVNFPAEMALKHGARPFPVIMTDQAGKPMNFPVAMGAGGGKADFFTIKGFEQSAYAELMNADGRVKVSMETGSSGLTDTELRASSVPVAQASGAIWSTAVIDIFGSTAASSVFNGDNRIKVSVETGGSGLTDAELRASSVPVAQASGASWSTSASIVSVSDIFSTTAASNVVNPDNRVKVELPATTVTVSDVTASVKSALIDSSGVQYSGSNPVPVTGSVSVSGSVTSTGAYLLDGDGSYRGTVPVSDAGGSLTIDGTVSVSGSITSTAVTGPTAVDAVDDGSAPVQQGGIARTANPTAVAGGDVVKSTHDDLGRQVMRPVQVRDLTLTAYATLTNGTETTLRSAVAGAYLDLIYVMGANSSDAAVTVDIRPVTAGNIVMTLRIPADGTAGIACPVPLPQADIGNNWTADMGDITGTTVYLTALFSQEI